MIRKQGSAQRVLRARVIWIVFLVSFRCEKRCLVFVRAGHDGLSARAISAVGFLVDIPNEETRTVVRLTFTARIGYRVR